MCNFTCDRRIIHSTDSDKVPRLTQVTRWNPSELRSWKWTRRSTEIRPYLHWQSVKTFDNVTMLSISTLQASSPAAAVHMQVSAFRTGGRSIIIRRVQEATHSSSRSEHTIPQWSAPACNRTPPVPDRFGEMDSVQFSPHVSVLCFKPLWGRSFLFGAIFFAGRHHIFR